jgi:hypothetical protein
VVLAALSSEQFDLMLETCGIQKLGHQIYIRNTYGSGGEVVQQSQESPSRARPASSSSMQQQKQHGAQRGLSPSQNLRRREVESRLLSLYDDNEQRPKRKNQQSEGNNQQNSLAFQMPPDDASIVSSPASEHPYASPAALADHIIANLLLSSDPVELHDPQPAASPPSSRSTASSSALAKSARGGQGIAAARMNDALAPMPIAAVRQQLKLLQPSRESRNGSGASLPETPTSSQQQQQQHATSVVDVSKRQPERAQSSGTGSPSASPSSSAQRDAVEEIHRSNPYQTLMKLLQDKSGGSSSSTASAAVNLSSAPATLSLVSRGEGSNGVRHAPIHPPFLAAQQERERERAGKTDEQLGARPQKERLADRRRQARGLSPLRNS